MGFVAPRLAFAPLVAVAVLSFGVGTAHAVTFDFTVSPPDPNEDQQVVFRLTPTEVPIDRVRWDLDGDGEFDDGTTRTVAFTYADPGPVTVRMRARETKDDRDQTVTKTIDVNGTPAADFGFTPAAPRAAEAVAFTPSVTDPDGDAVTLDWDFGDGERSAEGAPTHTFAAAGTYVVVLTATDEHGAFTTVSHQVTVGETAQAGEQPPAPPPDSGPADPGTGAGAPGAPGASAPTEVNTVTTSKPRPPVPMRPFPVIRIAGVVLPHGSLVTILSVRAPRGATVLARCRGRGCPVRTVARSSAVSLVRFRRFERRLPAGVSLELFVRKGSRIGKYTRFRIRAGKPPARVDRCLMPGRARPVRCP